MCRTACLFSMLLGLILPGQSQTKRQLQQGPVVGPEISEGLTQKLKTFYSVSALEKGVYVGSEFCIACHTNYTDWRDTKHAQALRRPMSQYSLQPGKGVVADYDGNGVDDFMQGLDFNEIDSDFNRFKPHAPVLSYQDGGYFIKIGELTMPIVSTQGGTGDWKQRFLVRVPVVDTGDGFSMENYVSPVQYNEKSNGYVAYHPEAWYDDSNAPRFDTSTPIAKVVAENNRTYSKACIGCHTTGIRDLALTETNEYLNRPFPAALFRPDDPSYFDYDHDGIFDIVNIGCEACHGPGSAHILAAGNPSEIVNPGKLETPQANMVCGQCHSRVKSVPNGTHGWPRNDETGESWIPGSEKDLTEFFTDASGRWPDGINSRQHHQQYFDFIESPKPGFRFHPVKCIECHDSHGFTTNKHLIRDYIVEHDDNGEVFIPTRDENDTLCLSCHASHGSFSEISKAMVADFENQRTAIGEIVSAHTNHPFAPERSMGLSRCSKCHNPEVAKSALDYDIHSHTFEVIPPEKNLIFQDQGGMPDSCSVSCHAIKVDSFGLRLDPNFSDWSDAHSQSLSEKLMLYFGPTGIWWQHSADGDDNGGNKQ